MSFDFDEIIDRVGTHSSKWDTMESKYGVSPKTGIPMWVADMDFRAPPAVQSALAAALDHGVHGYFGDDRFKISRIRLILNLLFLPLALFYAFMVRSHVLGDAFSVSIFSFIIQFSLSLLIFIAVLLIPNLLTIPLKRFKNLSKTLKKTKSSATCQRATCGLCACRSQRKLDYDICGHRQLYRL